MHFSIIFKTSKFDVSKEDENPINRIYGQSLLKWLKATLSDNLEISEPEAEDWGWYSYLDWKGRVYLLGASAYHVGGDEPKSELEWVFQVDKRRSFMENILGREKMMKDDECLLYFKSLFESESDFKDVEIE